MKRYYILPALISVLFAFTACGRDETVREPLQTLETVAPRSVTRSTYTGTTADFVYSSSTSAPRMGDGRNIYGNDIETGDTADGNYRTAETGINAEYFGSPETVTGDTSEGRAAYDPETAGVNDGFVDTYHDTRDTAAYETLPESRFSDTSDTSDRQY